MGGLARMRGRETLGFEHAVCVQKITIIFKFRGLQESDCKNFCYYYVGSHAPEV